MLIPRRDLSTRGAGVVVGGGGELNRAWGSFNLEMTIVSVRIQSGKAQVQEVLGHAGKDQNKIPISGCK